MNASDYPEEIRTLVADIGFEIGGDARVWELVDLVERVHARELAGKIRTRAWGYRQELRDTRARVLDEAADLIDPDVES